MRFLILALACLVAPAAAAQTTAPETLRAVQALSAIWRPVAGAPTAASLEAACHGAVEEMDAVDAALPPVLTPESLARVRALRGLLVVPNTETAGTAFFFPSRDLTWFASGVGVVSVINEGEGFLAVRDAEDHQIALQLGRAGSTPLLRLRAPGSSTILNFVGCAASAPR